VLHGNRTYLLQDGDGQIKEGHSISAGLDYPGIGPEHSWLKESGRVEYVPIMDTEALEAFQLLTRLEGIIPGAGTQSCAGRSDQDRAEDGQGPDHRDEPVRPRRQGHLHRRQDPRRGALRLIVVDLPPEMDEELCLPALKAGINFIRLATPTTDDKRLPLVLSNTSGFVYYVSMTGITGSAIADTSKVNQAVDRIKSHTNLPVCVGFGVKTAEQARAIGQSADGVVVGTAIVNQIANTLDAKGAATSDTVESVATMVRGLATGVRAARLAPTQ
jgi:hypothetical protein